MGVVEYINGLEQNIKKALGDLNLYKTNFSRSAFVDEDSKEEFLVITIKILQDLKSGTEGALIIEKHLRRVFDTYNNGIILELLC
jgi:hypothetical protein